MSNSTDNALISDDTNITCSTIVMSDGQDSSDYGTSIGQFGKYTGTRFLQVFFGIIGNVLTRVIIHKLNTKSNAHVIMAYLAVSDIAVCCIIPLSTYVSATETILESGKHWNTICIVKECLLWIGYNGCSLSYLILSVDR